ncbi:MAG: RHS repeat-associated core domain-containing protein [Phycisphaerae bacterium]
MTAGTLAGSGVISADGGVGSAGAGGGGGGRIALYYGVSTFGGSLSACGGEVLSHDGGAGTIFSKSLAQSWGDLLIDNCGSTETATLTPITSLDTLDSLVVTGGAVAELPVTLTLSDLQVGTSGQLTHPAGQVADLTVLGDAMVADGGMIWASMNLTVAGHLTIDAGCAITADGKGYGPASGPGAGGSVTSTGHGGGGGYGGTGGESSAAGGGTYGSPLAPVDLGSGGGDGYGRSGGSGGGALRLSVDGTLMVAGSLTAVGEDGEYHGTGWSGGGGSGGSIYVTAGTLAGSGVISADGGVGSAGAGGGGGGRIALYYFDVSGFSGDVHADGGDGYNDGEPGTVYYYWNEEPHVLEHRPNRLIEQPVDHIDVRFDEPLNGATFTADDLVLVDPNVSTFPVSDPILLGGNWWRITFAPQSTEGTYHLYVGPHIEDLTGLELNQDGDLTGGEEPDDVYDADFTVVFAEELVVGVQSPGAFTEPGYSRYYKFDVDAGADIEIQLDDLDDEGENELYVSFEQLPTRLEHDFHYTLDPSADQQVRIPGTRAGTYYVLAYGREIPAPGPSAFTIEAACLPLAITSADPSYGSNTELCSATVTIRGSGFNPAATVALRREGHADVPATSVSWIDTGTITTTLFLLGQENGEWSLVVSNPAAGEAAVPFTVLEAVLLQLDTSLVLPNAVGYHTTATIYVDYTNAGSTTISAPLLVLTASQNGRQAALLTLDSSRLVSGFWTSAIPEGFANSVQFRASGATPGVLQPGESGRVAVYYAGWQQPWDFSYPPINWSLGGLGDDNPVAVDWAALKADLRPPYIREDAWDAVWANFTNQVGSTWGDYVASLSENAVYLGGLGEQVTDIGKLLAFELLQADGLSPLRTLASAVDAAVEAPGLPLVFSRSFATPISQRFELGALGRGWSHNWQFALSEAADGTVTITGPGGSRRTLQPDSRDSSHYFTQPGDHATLTPLGGGVFSLQEPGGLLRVFRADGKLDYVEDTNGNRITCAYSGGLLASLTHSSGQFLQLIYNGAGRVESVTDHLNRATTFTYDGTDEHLLTADYYDGRTTTYAYDLSVGPSQHALIEATSSCCGTRYFDYDAQGRLAVTHLENDAEAVTFTYDTTGKVTATDAWAAESDFYFDYRGLLLKTEDALDNAVQMAFDNDYNLVRLTDPAGNFYEYAYDSKGNLTQSTDPLGNASHFTYAPPFNRLASVTDANENVTSYSYATGTGNLQSITYADDSFESWTYDAYGNPACWTNRRGNDTPGDPNDHVICYDYDADGRLTGKTYADGSQAEYVYDTRGNLTEARTLDPNQATVEESVMTYDTNDRLTHITYTGGQWLSFTYDAAGRRATSEDQLGHILNYFYDYAGRLESMTDELDALVVSYEYDAVGRLASKTLGNGIVTTYTYDDAGQLLTLTNKLADETPISWFDYTYDSRGRRTEMVTHYGTWTYDYDDQGQLTHAELSSTDPEIPDQDLTYVYDDVGNRTQTTENGVVTDYTPNNLNQYTAVGDTNYAFDFDGNLIQETSPTGTTTYTYNDENKLVAVSNGTDTWEYVYDALANRVVTTENGTTTRFVIDPTGIGDFVGEYDDAGNLAARYDYGVGLLARADAAGAAAYYTFDTIGSAHQLVTSAGAVANTYAYAPFGSLLQRTENIPSPFQFIGEFGVTKEENGLDFMRARLYRPHLGTFLSADPLGLAAGSANLYLYCKNNPVLLRDPAGLATWYRSDVVTKYGIKIMERYGPRYGLEIIKDVLAFPAGPSTLGSYFFKPLVARIFGGIGFVVSFLVFDVQPLGETEEELRELDPAYGSSGPPLSGGTWNPLWRPPSLPVPPAQPGGTGNSGTSGSRDPNIKTGPAGFGAANFVADGETFSYRIDFENDDTATAPAQQVVISDPLSSDLVWSTFRVSEVAFGDQLIEAPPDSQLVQATVPMSYLDTAFEVQLEVGIHVDTGEVYATFYSIDPDTGLPPPVDIGFLPPEDGTGRGMGCITFVIDANPGLATGTEIRNVACTQFDAGEIICTNQVDPHDPGQGTDPDMEALATIDADPPTSSVVDLPPATYGTPFTVTWTSDDGEGAGVAQYDVYLSVDGGPFGLWISTPEDSASLNGQRGHSYAFYTVATDGAGNVEDVLAEADTMTVVWLRGPGDIDGDADIDADDFAGFANCMAGPYNLPTPTWPDVTEEHCLDAFDFEDDYDVDLSDFAEFQRIFSGSQP